MSREMISQGNLGNSMSRLILSLGDKVRHFVSGDQVVEKNGGFEMGVHVGVDFGVDKEGDEGEGGKRNQAANVGGFREVLRYFFEDVESPDLGT